MNFLRNLCFSYAASGIYRFFGVFLSFPDPIRRIPSERIPFRRNPLGWKGIPLGLLAHLAPPKRLREGEERKKQSPKGMASPKKGRPASSTTRQGLGRCSHPELAGQVSVSSPEGSLTDTKPPQTGVLAGAPFGQAGPRLRRLWPTGVANLSFRVKLFQKNQFGESHA
jgi:hypothetical protein